MAFLILASSLSYSGEDKIFFIVNKSNPTTRLTTSQVSDYFLKRIRTWGNGETVRFFDRLDGSAARNNFLANVLRRTSREIDSFWIGQKLYSGDSAPVQVDSDRMVINLVARFPGAIGFVTIAPDEKSGVKTIAIEGLSL